MATQYGPPEMTTSAAADRARITSMIIVIGIIIFITGITAFIAGRLQSRGADLKQDIQSALTSTPPQGGVEDPAQKVIVNTEERERLRIMKQMNDQLLLGVITGGIVTISILIVSMLIVNMGEAQRHHALEQVEDLLPLPRIIPHRRRVGYDDDDDKGRSPRRRITPARNAANAAANAVNAIDAANVPPPPPATAAAARTAAPAAVVQEPPPQPMSEAELADHMSKDDFRDKQLPADAKFDSSIRGIGNLSNAKGGDREKFIESEAGKMIQAFYSSDDAERAAIRAEPGLRDIDQLDMNAAKELTRKRYGFMSNAERNAKRKQLFSRGMFGKMAGADTDDDNDSPVRLY
jgi:hypothetical protein